DSAVAIAGTGEDADSGGDGGPATEATFNSPQWIGLDRQGNIFLSDQRRDGAFLIRFINTGCTPQTFYPGTSQELVVQPGTIATIAGGGSSTSDGADARDASLQLLG